MGRKSETVKVSPDCPEAKDQYKDYTNVKPELRDAVARAYIIAMMADSTITNLPFRIDGSGLIRAGITTDTSGTEVNPLASYICDVYYDHDARTKDCTFTKVG